jgi:hypothetical protein
MTRTFKVSVLVVVSSLVSLRASAQDPAAAAPAAGGADATATPAAPAAPAPEKKKKTGGPSLGMSPEAPQVGGLVVSPAESVNVAEEPQSSEWKFDVSGYFRAPIRFSWGPPVSTQTAPANAGDGGTQLRTPPLVPDANYIDWRYTNSLVGPWTELNFHYGNDRVKATVQIASYNLTDAGYRRLEANLGINQAFLTLKYPELANVEDLHLTLTIGGFTNRYGAAGRYDAGKYETYLFGRTHVAGETATLEYDVGDFTFAFEEGFGGKLEPIPFYGPPGALPATNPNTALPVWEPYPGQVAQEPTFVAHVHGGIVYKKMLLFGAHYIDTFANGNELANAYGGQGLATAPAPYGGMSRKAGTSAPQIVTWGFDLKLLGGVLGDGYIGFSHLKAVSAQYLADAIEVLHSFGGWQLHDNFFGVPGAADDTTGSINSVEFQYVFSFGQLFHYPQAFWGDGPDLITSVFAMYNKVDAPMNPTYSVGKFKGGAEIAYIPLPWLGLGARYDLVEPNLSNSNSNFSVISPRIIFRTAFVTHEQVIIQYSRYFYATDTFPTAGMGGAAMFPYNTQAGGGGVTGADKNAATIAAIIWF